MSSTLVALLVVLVAYLGSLSGTHAQRAGHTAWELPKQVVNAQSAAFDSSGRAASEGRETGDHKSWDGVIEQAPIEEDAQEGSTIAKILDDRLKEEFKDDAVEDGKQYNETVLLDESKQETVVRISQSTTKKDEMHEDGDTAAETEHRNSEAAVESEVDRIIDSHDNEYVLSKPNTEGSLGLTLDPQLIRDMSLLIITSALAGQLMAALGQPTINGYFVAGSLLGQGGFGLAKEIVQLQSVSQLGVQFLLFTLGLELNLAKLKAVRNVALFGGILEVGLMAAMGSAVAFAIGAGVYHGAFVGALLAMSSTSIVVKCIQEARVSHQPHAQITIGTLVLQDCVVGLIFAFMPVLASASSSSGGFTAGDIFRIIGKVFGTLSIAVIMTILFALMAAPAFVQYIKRSSAETFQVCADAKLTHWRLSYMHSLRYSPSHPSDERVFTAFYSRIRPARGSRDHKIGHQRRAWRLHGWGCVVNHRGPTGHSSRGGAHFKFVPGPLCLLHWLDNPASILDRAFHGVGIRRGSHYCGKDGPNCRSGFAVRVPVTHGCSGGYQLGPSG